MAATGRFGKGVKGSVSLNLCLAGGKYCDRGCKHHPCNGGRCYATRAAKLYPKVKKALTAKEGLDAGDIVQQAIVEVDKKRKIPFFRFSVIGSLPNSEQATPKLRKQLVKLVGNLHKRGVPMHLPVEEHGKAEYYKGLLGDKVVVRLSIQDGQDFLTYGGACSVVVGGGETHKKGNTVMQQRIVKAKAVAKMRRNLVGRATMVCPAIGKPGDKSKMKCGQCTACSRSNIDVVYPLH